MTTTENTEAVQTPEDALAAYKKSVREEAFRVASQQNWCDDGLNETLRNLGLREKKDWKIPVMVTTSQLVTMTVKDGETMEEAIATLTDDSVKDYFRTYVSRTETVEGWKPFVHADGEPYRAGEPDPTNPGQRHRRDVCNASGPWAGFSCTQPALHHDLPEGTQHIAGDGTTVREVWNVDEDHQVMFYGYPTRKAAERDYQHFAWADSIPSLAYPED